MGAIAVRQAASTALSPAEAAVPVARQSRHLLRKPSQGGVGSPAPLPRHAVQGAGNGAQLGHHLLYHGPRKVLDGCGLHLGSGELLQAA